jgi:hypothetical protein
MDASDPRKGLANRDTERDVWKTGPMQEKKPMTSARSAWNTAGPELTQGQRASSRARRFFESNQAGPFGGLSPRVNQALLEVASDEQHDSTETLGLYTELTDRGKGAFSSANARESEREYKERKHERLANQSYRFEQKCFAESKLRSAHDLFKPGKNAPAGVCCTSIYDL